MREIKFRVWQKLYGGRMITWEELIEQMTLQIFNHKDYILMQYTGLKDKNGKEIYEGDIIKDHTNGAIIEVTFEPRLLSILTTFDNVREVIGNIYENPIMLKEDK